MHKPTNFSSEFSKNCRVFTKQRTKPHLASSDEFLAVFLDRDTKLAEEQFVTPEIN